MRLIRFGEGDNIYTFPPTEISLSDNFRDVVTATNRVPGMSGGFDEYGDGEAPTAVGDVRFSFWLHAQHQDEMIQKEHDLAEMLTWGRTKLLKEAITGEEQWCEARVNNITHTSNFAAQAHLRKRVTINFQAAEPFWYSIGTESWTWGDGTLWGTKEWGGGGTPYACTGLETVLTINYRGNAVTLPRIIISPTAGYTCQNPTVQRLVRGNVVDEVSFTDILSGTDSLAINARELSVRKNSVDAYSSAFSFINPAWFRLLPGENTVRVCLENATDRADVRLRYYEVFR